MEEIKSMLHLDVMTVTGKTLGENLEELKKNGFYEHCDEILREKSKLFGRNIDREDIIHSFEHAKGTKRKHRDPERQSGAGRLRDQAHGVSGKYVPGGAPCKAV